MSIKSMVNLQCFHTQYALAFLTVLSVTYLSCCVGCLVSFVANLIAVSVISWYLTKRIRKRFNKEPITSFKRAVLVTGCDSGFGNALAFKLNENGYRVYATVLDPKSDGAQKLLTGSRFDGKTHVFKMDVTNDEEVQSVYESVKEDLKLNGEELWAVVNNAGIVTFGPFDWGTIDSYKQVFEVNTFGMVRVTRTFLPLLRQSKGRVVNLVSVAGRITSPVLPIYSMSKHAAISFSDAIRRELRKYGIRVSTVEPTTYKTPMATEEFFARQVDRLWDQTSDEVKQVYGEEYHKALAEKRGQFSVLFKPGENIYEVIDALVDAVRSPDPQIRYSVVPGGCLKRCMVDLMQKLPLEVADMYTYRAQRKSFRPANLRNEE